MTAAELLQHHAVLRLGAYGRHFKSILKALEEGDIPELSHPEVQTHLPTLRDHLRRQGAPNSDDFVLRYALTIPGSQRGIRPPIEVLEANRGGLSKARLGEVASAVKSILGGLPLARMLTDLPDQDALTVIKEAAALLDRRGGKDKLLRRDLYMSLSSADVADLTGKALELAGLPEQEFQELAGEMLSYIAGTQEAGLGNAADVFAASGEFEHPHLFRGASERAVQSILGTLEDPGGKHRNLPLLALAWTRNPSAVAAFRRWQSSPPAWASDLYIPPASYLSEAALSLDAAGEIRELASGPCHLLDKEPDPSSTIPVPCREPAGIDCPGCENPLSWLFDFTAVPDRFLPWDAVELPRKILNCHYCTCYSPFFTRYAADGAAALHPATVFAEPEEAYPLSPAKRFLQTAPLPTFVASIPYSMEGAVVLGGLPAWIQDAEYPSCPDCRAVMRFLAFFDNGSEREEGTQYAFFCPACRVAAATYQQS